MRKIYYIIHFTFCILMLSSCDGWKWDENGDLDGMWKLTEWRDKSTGNILKTQDDALYYSFQLKVMKMQNQDISKYYISYFTHTGDSLFLETPVRWPEDKKYEDYSELAPYGVPSNGHFHVDALNSKNMVLSSPVGILSFRKY